MIVQYTMRKLTLAMLLNFAIAHTGCAPDIPHPVNATDDAYCRKCHSGRAGAPNSGHNDRNDCTSCHDVGTNGPYPELIPHLGGDPANCHLCHDRDADGTDAEPYIWNGQEAMITSHINEKNCYDCHEALAYGSWPQPMPGNHEEGDDSFCLNCHDPISHSSVSSCNQCHLSQRKK